MKTGIVEMISGNKIMVGFEDGTMGIYVNSMNLDIKENYQVDIEDEKIINVHGIDEKLYKEIKELEKENFKL